MKVGGRTRDSLAKYALGYLLLLPLGCFIAPEDDDAGSGIQANTDAGSVAPENDAGNVKLDAGDIDAGSHDAGSAGGNGDAGMVPDAGETLDSGFWADSGSLVDAGYWDGGAAEETFAFYAANQVHSPITAHAVDRMMDIYNVDPFRNDDVFMKAGASSTVSSNTLHCFASSDVDLGEYAGLSDTLQFFLEGDAAGDTSFDRYTVAARSGHSAGWVISGDPSPLEEESALLNPRFAFVHYGTNDMGLGSTYASAMPGFYGNMMELFDILTSQGVIPLVFGISPRLDSANADLWVDTYNAAIRGMAQARQVPFVDLHWATRDLDGFGMASDGLHLNRYSDGACILTDAGLGYGYNVRNLISLEVLDRMVDHVVLEEGTYDENVSAPMGQGTIEEPWEIHSIPYTDYRDTRNSLSENLDYYSGCESDSNETGPEWVYRLELDETTALRAMVLDRAGVDIDIHLLGGTVSEASCLMRAHRYLEVTLDPGVYHFALDSWVNGSEEVQSGEFLFMLVTCRDNDADCSDPLPP